MSNGAPSQVPGWYITFQTAVLMQLPRPGQIDQNTAEVWSGNQGALKGVLTDALLPAKKVGLSASNEAFVLLNDFGVVTVPDEMSVDAFSERWAGKLNRYNKGITDADFPSLSHVLKPGDKLRVKAFQQVTPTWTTSKERIAFLEKQPGNVFLGMQGTMLAFEQKRDRLHKGRSYASFAAKTGDQRVPSVHAYSDGYFDIDLCLFKEPWDKRHVFFGFSYVR